MANPPPPPEASSPPLTTTILPISLADLGTFSHSQGSSFLHPWTLELSSSPSAKNLLTAVHQLHTSSVPIAFPTETVYGLAADATSSASVRGIYTAKQRPSDNPLIVHIASLQQLRALLAPAASPEADPIPAIYHPLIQRFWPGPLTILLPLPTPSPLAPEVSAGLATFGARMPASKLALALIRAADRPLAAPSANASTKPSPTTAQHVAHDLDARISLILDGGPCAVGVESTVVDGLCHPPAVLRPGGVGIEEIRACDGWARVVKAYHDSGANAAAELAPRAPGMKYRHYAPKARVVLVDAPLAGRLPALVADAGAAGRGRVAIVRTKTWPSMRLRLGQPATQEKKKMEKEEEEEEEEEGGAAEGDGHTLSTHISADGVDVWEAHIGPGDRDVARQLFSALRELDGKGVDVIFVEAIDGEAGETAAAVMNRLGKAAAERIEM